MSSNLCYKLTGQKNQTKYDCLWVPGEWNPKGVLSGEGGLCSGGFYHAYDTPEPLVALFLNPIHGGYQEPVVWKAEWRGKREDDGVMKFGATELRLIEKVSVPSQTTVQRVAFGIFTARAVYQDPTFNDWADKWLSGEDRSWSAAASVAESAVLSAAASAESAAWSAWSAASAASAAASAESVGFRLVLADSAKRAMEVK